MSLWRWNNGLDMSQRFLDNVGGRGLCRHGIHRGTMRLAFFRIVHTHFRGTPFQGSRGSKGRIATQWFGGGRVQGIAMCRILASAAFARSRSQRFKRGTSRQLFQGGTRHHGSRHGNRLVNLRQAMIQNVQIGRHMLMWRQLVPWFLGGSCGGWSPKGGWPLPQPRQSGRRSTDLGSQVGSQLDALSFRQEGRHLTFAIANGQGQGLRDLMGRGHGGGTGMGRVSGQPRIGPLQETSLVQAHLFFLVITQANFVAKQGPHGLRRRHAVRAILQHLEES